MFVQMWPNLIFNDCACVCQCEGSRLGGKKKKEVDAAQLNFGTGPLSVLVLSTIQKTTSI